MTTPALPAPLTPHTQHALETRNDLSRVKRSERQMQFPPRKETVDEFKDPETNRRKVNDLLFAAFPAASQHAVSQRASLVIGRDARTIRSWMEGRTVPNWDEMAIIAGYAGFERAMRIIFGGRN